ncbi:hypothetical protein H632_c4227p0 [Helicosporidium sp. ATCC 50920]|nr:hypothetical protein H632_c4227p0 [Helicosporidium sp. ATCC 50920]|eukprot:KDD71885.1 hypothetical protein H632_c4227p0 [Helicosporidium sp. ATCC 50920]
MDIYLQELLPDFTRPGDDGNYGSAVMYDVAFLQVVSRRVHYGKFVAEAKFREDTQLFTHLIRTQDREGLMQAITDTKVEAKASCIVEGEGDDVGVGCQRATNCPS